MLASVTPQSLLQKQVSSLQDHTPAVLDGGVDGVHAARIATRRIRELLPLTGEWHRPDVVDSLSHRFRAVGRALGKVRDADVRILLLKHLEPRIPTAAAALLGVRQQQERRRLELMRKLIKQFEQEGLLELMNEAMPGRRASTGWGRGSGRRWQQQLQSVLSERAQSATDAVHHATGVYFPHRAHSARIAIKKLRYVLEIAEATRTLRTNEAIPDLKKAQDILGDLHDRQELIDELADAVPPGDGARTADQLGLVTQVVEADIYDLHARYLARRSRVLTVADRARHLKAARHVATPLMIVAGALAVSSGLVVAQSSWRRLA
jgi:CHAD domain-containing protein